MKLEPDHRRRYTSYSPIRTSNQPSGGCVLSRLSSSLVNDATPLGFPQCAGPQTVVTFAGCCVWPTSMALFARVASRRIRERWRWINTPVSSGRKPY